jgi:hypothetical protein
MNPSAFPSTSLLPQLNSIDSTMLDRFSDAVKKAKGRNFLNAVPKY